jgi:hypothetical protein
MVDVTLSWTDSDTEKTYLGQRFTNGETRAICPTRYGCSMTYGTIPTEWWSYYAQYLNPTMAFYACGTQGTYYSDTTGCESLDVWGPEGGARLQAYATIGYTYPYYNKTTLRGHTTSALSTYSYGVLDPAGPISDAVFGHFQDTSGVTVEWARGRGAWGVC